MKNKNVHIKLLVKTIHCLAIALVIVVIPKPNVFAATADTTFLQSLSVKYKLAADLQGCILKKVVVDYNDNVFVLTDKGVCRAASQKIIKNILYRPLAAETPIDIALQEKTGYLYYLYDNNFFSNEEAGKPYGKLPNGVFNKLAVAANGDVLLTGKGIVSIYNNQSLKNIASLQDDVIEVLSFNGSFYILCSNAVYSANTSGLKKIHSGSDFKTFACIKNNLFIGTSNGYYGINKNNGTTTLALQQKIPVENISSILAVGNNLWIGTPHGAFTKNTNGGFKYFASKRWLDNDQVTDISADGQGNIYLLTPTGLSAIMFVPYSYSSKANYFEKKIRERHIRYGLLAEVNLKTPGDLSTAEMIDTDNDGLWTSFYLGAMALKHAVTADAAAKRYAWESFAAYERLISINQLKGFPSRTFERKGFKVSDPEAWRAAPDSAWEWKGTTSSDEFVGYIFIASLMDQFIAKTANEKKRVADFIDKILEHIITNNYNFVDLDGQPTLWGRWHPDYINWFAKTISDRKVGSTHIIAGLQVAYALTKKEIYKKEAYRLMNEHGYLENIMISPYNIKATPGYIYRGIDLGTGPWNHSDDEMEFLSYWVLYHYAFSKELKQQYAKAIQEFMKIEAPEKHPAWNLITLGTAGTFDKEGTLWYLREYPLDLIRWDIKNSHRKDLIFMEPNFRNQYTSVVLSPAERPANRFNANEFTLDGGNGGRSELTGTEYLFSYWMARYLNVIK